LDSQLRDNSGRADMVLIRLAVPADLDGITGIYNQAIEKTVATFDTEPKTIEEQRLWFEQHDSQYPIIVAELEGRVVGWASLSRWSDRCAYSRTAEISLYVSEELQGKGIGRRLMEAVMKEGEEAGLRTVIARIAEGNPVSISLHESAGFEHIGVMKKVGEKFGRMLDVHLMQKIYGDDD
jgi:L-amino acid N-acyltransferase YncA